MNIDPNIIAEIQQKVQQGVELKNILFSLKQRGFTPQVAERILFMAYPELKQAQTIIKNSGMNTQQFINQIAKQNNIPINQVNNEFADMRKMFN